MNFKPLVLPRGKIVVTRFSSFSDDTNMAEFFWDAVLSVELRPNPYVVTALGVSIFEDRVHTIFPFKEHGDLHSILVNKVGA